MRTTTTMKFAVIAALASLAAAAPGFATETAPTRTAPEADRTVQIVSELNEKYCVQAPGPAAATKLVMQYCDADSVPNSTMSFRFTAKGELRAQLFWLTDHNKCIDGSRSVVNFVRLQPCNGSAAQRWAYDESDRQLSNGLDLCLDPVVVPWDPELYPGRELFATGCHNPVTSPSWALADTA